MKKLFLAVLLLAIAVVPALAQDINTKPYESIGALRLECAAAQRTAWANDNNDSQYVTSVDYQSAAFCLGYIAGVIDGTTNMPLISPDEKKIYLMTYHSDPTTTLGNLQKIVFQYIQNNALGDESLTGLVVLKALKDAGVMQTVDVTEAVQQAFRPAAPKDSRKHFTVPRNTLPGGGSIITNQ